LSCKNEELKQVKKDGYLAIQRDCDAEKAPSNSTRVFLQAPRITLDQAILPESKPVQSLSTALQTQEKIGFYNIFVGFLSTDWTIALDKLGAEHPQSIMQLLVMIWDHLCEPIWTTRNNILHSTNNYVTTDNMTSLKDKLLWYQHHQDEVLNYRHRYLADFEMFDLNRWSHATRRACVERLNNARRYHQRECKQRRVNQSTINNWLLSCTCLRSGCPIGPGLSNPLADRTQTHRDDNESTAKFEFDWDPGDDTQMGL